MTRPAPPLEKLITATQKLLQAVIHRELVRAGKHAEIAQRQAVYRARRGELERQEAEKQS